MQLMRISTGMQRVLYSQNVPVRVKINRLCDRNNSQLVVPENNNNEMFISPVFHIPSKAFQGALLCVFTQDPGMIKAPPSCVLQPPHLEHRAREWEKNKDQGSGMRFSQLQPSYNSLFTGQGQSTGSVKLHGNLGSKSCPSPGGEENQI